MKVLKANLVKKDRNQVKTAIRKFKEQKADETVKQFNEDIRLYRQSESERKTERNLKNKLVIEA